jgi:cytochrome c
MKSALALFTGILCAGWAFAQTGQSPTTGAAGFGNDNFLPPESSFRKVVLDGDGAPEGLRSELIDRPMEIAIAPDGRVFSVEGPGTVKMWRPDTKKTTIIGKVPVFFDRKGGFEDGLLGVTLDPKFSQNGWIYLNHSLPETLTNDKGGKYGYIRVSRYTLKGDQLDLASEVKVIDIEEQRVTCCHVGGSLTFDSKGNLYVSVGDNTNPFASDGYSPSDEQDGRYPWDAQRSAANPNALTGKILRIKPKADGGYSIPEGNLFKPGTAGTRPEIYVMGNRNPFRISVDPKNGYLYWGEVGPDAGNNDEKRGPAGHDEVNQARKAGFFGWPYFVGNNKPYRKWDFAKKTSGDAFNPEHPVNNSPNNTGIHDLPPAQPAFIWYPPGPSTKFPVVGSGGRTAMAGPVYYFNPKLKSETKLPKELDHTLFIYEWTRNWIIAVKLDDNDNIAKMQRFMPKQGFIRPVDLELGPDGCLYVMEYGTSWDTNKDAKLVRIDYIGSPANN